MTHRAKANIVYTKHLLEEATLRRIAIEKVKSCLQDPDIVQTAKEGKKAYLKDFGANYLKVIAAEDNGKTVVITAYWFAKSRLKSIK